ncbi:hypothetical protein HK104_002591 [Borealophlyctis nickersoniae]|nr:hypothetical protein HK104_002591 [Borealophlyctis nickersoniae]
MEQETNFDVIVLGTSLTESIVAGALSRAGKKVLHLDDNEFYGGSYASFDIKSLLRFFHQGSCNKEKEEDIKCLFKQYSNVSINISAPLLEDPKDGGNRPEDGGGSVVPNTEQTRDMELAADGGPAGSTEAPANVEGEGRRAETSVPTARDAARNKLLELADKDAEGFTLLRNLCAPSLSDEPLLNLLRAPDCDISLLSNASLLCGFLRDTRKFNLELSPKLLFCRGPLVELLVSSGVGRYLEFKALEQVYLRWEGAFEKVPGSKEDVFSSQSVTLLEKRRLMKFLNMALGSEEQSTLIDGYEDRPFIDFLASQNLGPRLSSVILNAIALILDPVTANTISTKEGLSLAQRHLQSLGRWGKTAFLVGLYGLGSELAQAFCRLSAVYGGVYMLNFEQLEWRMSTENQPIRVKDKDGIEYTANHLVTSPIYSNVLGEIGCDVEYTSHTFWRGIAIMDAPIHQGTSLDMTIFPPGASGNKQGVVVFQQSWETAACPKPYHVVYLCTQGGSKEDLQHVLEALQSKSEGTAPTALLSVLYEDTVKQPSKVWPLDNVAVCSPASSPVDFEEAAVMAKEVFERICPEGEFLPTVPDPEELA